MLERLKPDLLILVQQLVEIEELLGLSKGLIGLVRAHGELPMDRVNVVNELLGEDFVVFLHPHGLDRVVHVVLDRAIQAFV